MGHAHAALRPIGPCVLSVQMSVFIIKHKAASKDTASKASYRAAKQRESGTETHAIEKNHRQEDRTRRLRTPSLTCSALWHSLQFDLRSDVSRCLWNSAHTRDRGCKQHADGHLWSRDRWAKEFKPVLSTPVLGGRSCGKNDSLCSGVPRHALRSETPRYA